MGLLDILPWRKKEDDSMFDELAQSNNEGFSNNQSFDNSSFDNNQGQDPFNDPFGADLSRQYDAHKQQTAAPAYPQENNPSFQERSFGNPMSAPLPEPSPTQSTHPPSDRRDIELVLAKLDAIKSELDSVHQRVRTMEQAMGVQEQPNRRYKW